MEWRNLFFQSVNSAKSAFKNSLLNARKSLFYVVEIATKTLFSGQKLIQYIAEPEVTVAFLGFKPIQDIVEP